MDDRPIAGTPPDVVRKIRLIHSRDIGGDKDADESGKGERLTHHHTRIVMVYSSRTLKSSRHCTRLVTHLANALPLLDRHGSHATLFKHQQYRRASIGEMPQLLATVDLPC